MNRRALGSFLLGFVLIAGCAPGAEEGDDTDPGANEEELNKGEVPSNLESVARAKEWSDAKLAYCWAPNGGNNHRAGNFVCSEICVRQKNPLWDPYRSDCSGLVSWAWNLPAPGRITTNFAPFQNDITTAIEAKDLRPGDAINNKTHIMLFKEWITPGKKAAFIEEPGCGGKTPHAIETTSEVSLNGKSITLKGRSTFTAIRYNKIKEGAANEKPVTEAPKPQPVTEEPGPSEPEDIVEVTPSMKGSLDKVSCEGIEGWALGSENKPVGIELSFFAELGRTGSKVSETTANMPLPGLSAERKDAGFSVPMPLGARDGREHPVSAYATDSKGNAVRIDQPKTFVCLPPDFPLPADKAVRRPVSPKVLESWNMSDFENVARQSEAKSTAYEVGPELPGLPMAVKTANSSATFVVDGELRRPVDTASLKAWRLATRTVKQETIDSLTEGPAWPSAPFLFHAGEGAEIYLLDEKVPEKAGTGTTAEVEEERESISDGEDGQPDESATIRPQSDSDDEEDDSSPKDSSSKKKKKTAAVASGGCSQHGTSSPADMTGALLVAATVVAARRRKK